MPKILVSNNNEILRHLATEPFRHLSLDVLTASSGDEILAVAELEAPDVAIFEAEVSGMSGYDLTRRLKAALPKCSVVLLMGERISAAQMQQVTESGCNEVLIAPMTADELYDVVAIQLGLPRHGGRPYSIEVAQVTDEGSRPIEAQVSNLSVDGARLVVPEPLAEGAVLDLAIRFDERDALDVRAQVVWAQQGESATVVGASFEALPKDVESRLERLTQWEIVQDTARTRIVIKGDFTEAMSLDKLSPQVVGRVDFDMSQVRYMNSLGVREWVRFLENANAQGYEFHACSVAFVLQASMVKGMLGRGIVASFFAPYHCESCDRQEEKLLQSAAVLAAEYEPPTFTCPSCDGSMVLDEVPERYFAFLRPARQSDDS